MTATSLWNLVAFTRNDPGTTGSETMPGICKNNVIALMLHGFAKYYMFSQLATD